MTNLSLFSTMICGLWIEYSGQPKRKSDLTFHLGIALFSILLTIITFITFI